MPNYGNPDPVPQLQDKLECFLTLPLVFKICSSSEVLMTLQLFFNF